MLINLESLSPVLVMISSMSVPLFRGYPSLTFACAGLLEPKGSELGLLKSTFSAENFIRRLSWSISSHFGAIQC